MNRTRILTLLSIGHACEHWYFGLLGPILPFLVKEMDISFTQVGLLVAGRSFLSGVSSAGTGIFINVVGGGKWVLAISIASIALLHGGVSLAPSLLVLFPFFLLSGVATHIWHPPAMGLIGEQFYNRKGFAFGVHGTGANIGQTVAPFLAGYLLLFFGWRAVLQLNMIPLLLVSLLLAAYLPPFRLGETDAPAGAGGRSWYQEVSNSLLKNPPLVATSLLFAIRTMVHTGMLTFFPILIAQKFGAGPGWIGFALAFYAASSIVPETLIGYTSDRISRKTVILAGMVVSTIALAFIPILPPGPLLLAMLFFVGAFMMSLRPVLFAYAMDISPPHLGGSVVGLMFTSNQIFAALGPILVGFLSDLYGPDKAFFFYAAISVLFLPFFILMPNLPAADRVDEMASPEPGQGPSAS